MPVSGYWILKAIFYLLPSTGIFDQHQVSSNQHLHASSNKVDKLTQPCQFEV